MKRKNERNEPSILLLTINVHFRHFARIALKKDTIIFTPIKVLSRYIFHSGKQELFFFYFFFQGEKELIFPVSASQLA